MGEKSSKEKDRGLHRLIKQAQIQEGIGQKNARNSWILTLSICY